MIKRTFLLSLLVLLSASLYADNVSPEKAKAIAGRFFSRFNGSESVTQFNVQTKSSPNPEYYIFNSPEGGFVIISGDDAISPVLGYSLVNNFNWLDVPPALVEWLEGIEKGIRYERVRGSKPNALVKAKWESPDGRLSTKGATEKILETALWNQGSPFNKKCPKVDDKQSVTGCVATAACIIMRYYKWPLAGKGTLPSYTYKTDKGTERTQEGHALGHEYDWDNMPLDYSHYTTAQADAVATLMFDAGVMSSMRYDSDGSSAVSSKMVDALVQYMSYDASAHEYEKAFFTDEEWTASIRNEIDASRPVIYSARTEEDSGHCFILDGYDSDGMLHLNFGWSGRYNGFYALPEFRSYTLSHTMFVNIMPDKGGQYVPDITYSDIDTDDVSFEVGNEFIATVYDISESSYNEYSASFAIFLENAKGERVAKVSVEKSLSPGKGKYYPKVSFTCCLNSKPAQGDVLVPYYKLSSSDKWERLIFLTDGPGAQKLYPSGLSFLEEKVTLSYNKQSEEFTVSTPANAEVSLYDNLTGDNMKKAVSKNAPGSFTLKLEGYPIGTYVLKVKVNNDFIRINLVK